MNRLALSLLLVALAGCSQSVAPTTRFFGVAGPNSERVETPAIEGEEKMESGVDTHDTVRDRLGQPMAKATLRAGGECGERWVYSRPTIVAGDPKMHVLLVDFDERGVVCGSVHRDE